jgi:hypothetical protein
MEPGQYSAPISRVLTVGVGLIVTVMGAALLGFFGLGAYRLGSGLPSTQVLLILFIVGALGLALCVVGLRLITGRRRRDGGLFSPWALRFGGLIFLFGPVAAVLVNRSWFGLLEAGVSLSAGAACFVLANRREQAGADPGRLTIVGGDRDAR